MQDLHFSKFPCRISIFLSILQTSCKSLARHLYPIISYKILAKLLRMQDVLQKFMLLQRINFPSSREIYYVIYWKIFAIVALGKGCKLKGVKVDME